MPPNTKRLFYVNTVAAPVYLEILAKRPDIHIDKLTNKTSDGMPNRSWRMRMRIRSGQAGRNW